MLYESRPDPIHYGDFGAKRDGGHREGAPARTVRD